jgi:solute carrier family 25 oxoglutarate transporter 11
MKKGADGTFPYKNIFDTMFKTAKNEGFTHLWVGYPTFYLRIAPHVCITLIAQDFITEAVKSYRSGH